MLEDFTHYNTHAFLNNKNYNFKVFGTEKLTSCFSQGLFRENTETPYRGYTSVIESSSTE